LKNKVLGSPILSFTTNYKSKITELKMNYLKSRIPALEPNEFPNLGEMFIKLRAKTDAINAIFKRINDIAKGDAVMPFLHAIFLLESYILLDKDECIIKQLEIVVELSKVRQIRLIRKVNQRIKEMSEQYVQFEITDDMVELMNRIDELVQKALNHDVNPFKYLDESTDEDDILQSTNEFCMSHWVNNLSKNIHPDMLDTGDFIRIITDIDGIDWVVVISRKNGPGKGHFAWAGGYKDDGETLTQASKREGDEETSEIKSGNDDDIEVTTTEYVLNAYDISYWDIRYYNAIALSHGIKPKHGGCLVHTTYKLINSSN